MPHLTNFRRILILLMLLAATTMTQLSAQSHEYSLIKLDLPPNGMHDLTHLGLDVDHPKYNSDGTIELYVNYDDLEIMRSEGFEYEVLIENFAKYYEQRAIQDRQKVLTTPKSAKTADRFGYGSMGGFYTFAEIVSKLDQMTADFPNIASQKFSIGTTLEGRDIWALRISDNPNVDENEDVVHFDAMHHAREPLAMATVINFAFWMLENYDTDPQIKQIIDNREIYIVPCVNPDGYEYNRATNPNGGGLWRKNRRNNSGSSCDGVDLNRNYSYDYNAGGGCSSGDPCSNTFRGPNSFSEPESRALRDFLLTHNPNTAFSVHSTAGNYITPAHSNLDFGIYSEWGSDMFDQNDYPFGTTFQMLGYSACGTTSSYMYEQGIYGWTPEIDGSGFWPAQSEIFALVDENIYPLFYQSFLGGQYTDIQSHEVIGSAVPGSSFQMTVEVKNKGVGTAPFDVEVELVPLQSGVTVSGNGFIGSVPARTKATSAALTIDIDSDYSQDQVDIEMVVRQGGVEIDRERIAIPLGSAQVLFSDDASSGSNWTSSGSGVQWGVTQNDSYGGNTSFGDSNNGNSVNNSLNYFTLNSSIDLTSTANPTLEFYSKWSLDIGDFVRLQASTNNGNSWFNLATFVGTESWDQRLYDLTPYVSNQFRLRFLLDTDGSLPSDGFYFDKISITDYDCQGTLEGTVCDDGDPCTINDVYDTNCNCAGTFSPDDCDPGCFPYDFVEFPIIGYDPGQDFGSVAVQDGGITAFLTGNAWKAVQVDYTVTPDTYLEFEFRSTSEGEIHEIAFDNDLFLSRAFGVVVYGNQGWTGNFSNPFYSGSGNYETFKVHIGSQYTGTYTYMVLVNDDDVDASGNSHFRNVRLYEDTDGDGNCDENCPSEIVGTSCDDGDVCTINDAYDNSCNCVGVFADADFDGVCDADDVCPGFNDNLIGSSCDDGDDCTVGDTYNNSCNCVGTFADSDGDGVCDADDLCDGFDDNLIGTSCDDGDICTVNDVYDNGCNCIGTFADADGDDVCDADDVCPGFNDNLIGTSCDDGDNCTTGDTYGTDCNCAGTYADADGDGVCDADDVCPGFDDNLIGTSCNDGDDCTSNDVFTNSCECAGTPNVDSDGDGVCDENDVCPGFDDNLIGTGCDDGDVCTTGDTYGTDCNCAGTYADADGDGVCDADDVCPGFDDNLIGTSCNDGDDCTTGDTYGTDCNCAGTFADADGDGVCDADDVCQGFDDNLIGTGCDDGDVCTVGDTYGTDCNCAGTYADSDGDGVCDADDICAGLDDNLIGTACDDGNVCTVNDLYSLDCNCVGTFADLDGDGVCDADDVCPGFDDNLIGTSCNDGDACTTGDTYGTDCNCVGTYADADGDGVCDNDDICPNGDDLIDNNNNGVPDACDISCVGYNFNDDPIIGYDPGQDFGTVALQDGGITAFMTGNGWKAVDVGYTITSNTYIEFDFKSTSEGEIHEIAFDNDLFLSRAFSIVVYGNQGWFGNFSNPFYSGSGNYESFKVHIGSQYTGSYTYMVLVNDDDVDASGNSYFRNIRLYEDADGDGVCDDDDICPGGDDNIDNDNNGIPDACEGGGGCAYVTIDFNDFESGFGIWNDGGSDCRRSSNDAAYANSGNYCVRIRDNTSSSVMTTDNLDLSSVDEIEVNFSFIAASMENNEDFWLQVSTNGGSTYTTVADWDTGDEFVNGQRRNESVTISGPFTSNTRLRFRCDASVNNDRIFIDDVEIRACVESVIPTIERLEEKTEENDTKLSVMVEEKAELDLYPNPATDKITLELFGQGVITQVQILNNLGYSVVEHDGNNQKKLIVGLEQLRSAQVYMAVVYTSNGERIIGKFVKP